MNGNKWIIIALLMLVAVGIAVSAWARQKAQTGRMGKPAPISFPGANVRLSPPLGFEVAQDFEGFGLPSVGASVLVTQVPGPFTEVTAGFTPEQMRPRGLTLVSKEKVTVGSLPGLLLSVSQTAQGVRFDKWLLAFGDADATHLVTATFPHDQAARFSSPLKAAVLAARRDKGVEAAPRQQAEAQEQTPFAVDSGSLLKPARGMGKMLAFTHDGAIPTKAPTDPLFIVAPSLGAVAVGDRNSYARKRLMQTAQVTGITFTAQSPLRVDDLDGVEIVGRGQDQKTGAPLTLYQAMLFDDAGYYLMQGIVGTDAGRTYLPAFKTVARTFRRKAAR